MKNKALYDIISFKYFSFWLTVVDWKPGLVKKEHFWIVLILIWETEQFSPHNCWDFSLFQDYGNVKKWARISPLTGFLRISYGTQSRFLQNSFCWGCWCFWTSAEHHHASGSGNSVFCSLPWVDYQFSDLFGTDLQTIQVFLISSQR